MKVLSWNTGYFLGYHGLAREYVRHPVRGVIGTQTEMTLIDSFTDLVQIVAPDVVALQEVDTGSIRTKTPGQLQYIADHCSAGYTPHTHSKYGNTVVERLPIFRHMANGVLYRDGTVTDHVLDTGVKALVQEVQVNGISIFSVHLALGRRTRQRQLAELADLVAARESAVVVGDFNTRSGTGETTIFEDRCDFTITSPGNTYPAVHPQRPLDLVAHSPDLAVTCQKQDVTLSDHTPVTVTIENA